MERVDAIYARQSIDKADSISIESQIEFCTYETRGAPHRIYQDKGYSGKNTHRPEFQKMLRSIRAGEISRVICYKLDRCSRSILDFAALMEEFGKYGVEFVSCTEKFDTASPMGRAMLNICIVFAQLERETIQQRVYDAYHSRNRRGFYMGGKVPFGFRLVPHELEGRQTSRYEMVPEEVRILETMYCVYENPMTSLGDVVTALKNAGIPHPRKADGSWSRSHIGRMLRNPIYVKADLSVYEYFRDSGAEIHNDPDDFIGTNGCYLFTEKGAGICHLVLAPHEGFISSDIWLRCRKKHLPSGGKARQYRIKNTWLAGKIKCAKCGYALVTRKTVKSGGKEFRYLACSGPKEKCDGLHGMKADEIESLVATEIQKKLSRLPAPPQTAGIHAEEKTLNLRLAQLTRQIEKTAAKSLEATGPLFDYLSHQVAQLDSQRQACLQKMQALESSRPQNRMENLLHFPEWDHLTLEDKMLVVDALINKITLREKELTILWKL